MPLRDPIYDRLLEPETMREARAALIGRYEWFIHLSQTKNFEGIKSDGLKRNDPDRYFPYQPSESEIRLVGVSCREILCLTPLGLTMNKNGRLFCVAVHRNHLPHRVAMDYSCPDVWKRAAEWSAGPPALSDPDLFLKVVEEAASVACHDTISPNNLRVWVKGAPRDRPEVWPLIEQVQEPDKYIDGVEA